MALAVGVRLGPYEILALIGAGGMGEVYKAHDTRLDRTVAIKILPERVADDADRRRRFEQEARAVSALNHPHICTLHDIGSAPSTASMTGPNVDYLVMEYVEGQTLAERLAKGPVPLSQVLEYAIQIADALACAHDTHIVHRDLKPGNIMLTKGGVKLLDFGLAKLRAAATSATAGASDLLTQNPTTTPGSVIGTFQYMPPEQLEGRAVDARADIWAFGCVLYEMTTGRQPFEGRSHASLIAAILEREPSPMTTLDPMSPPSVEHLVRRCLAKDPDGRWQSARDLLHELQWVAESNAHTGVRGTAAAQRGQAVLPWLAAAVLATVGGTWVGYVGGARNSAPREAQQVAIELAADQEVAMETQAVLTFSPDGGTLVFSGRQGGRQTLFRRKLGDRGATAIPGTEDGIAPFFSPDGRWIGFRARRQLMRVSVEGGRPFVIGRCGVGAVWLTDGTIVYNRIYTDGLSRVPAEGGEPQRLTTPDRAAGELGHFWPDVLPGGRFVIFTAYRTPIDRSRVEVLDLETRTVRRVVDGGFLGRYAPTGHLLYVKGRRLFALPFDAAHAEATGPAIVVLDDVFADEGDASASYAVSRRGALAYVAEALGRPARELVWLDRDGHKTPATADRRAYVSASLSPDGRQAAVTLSEDSLDLWTLPLDPGPLSRLTTGDISEFDPKWSRDGTELFYVVSTPDYPTFELYRMPIGKPDGGRPIWDDRVAVDTIAVAISPDGRTLAFERNQQETGLDIFTRPLDGSVPARAFRATRAEEQWPSFSPDGRWIAYASDETGRPEIYVDSLEADGRHTQVSSDGGTLPVWTQSGEIFYRAGDQIRVVRTRLANGFEFDAPRTLFWTRIVSTDDKRTFDVSPDGQRILAVTIPEESRTREIDLLLDWAARLARENR